MRTGLDLNRCWPYVVTDNLNGAVNVPRLKQFAPKPLRIVNCCWFCASLKLKLRRSQVPSYD
jgi:hypothetical protein